MPSFYSFFRRTKDSKKKGADANLKDALSVPNRKVEPDKVSTRFPGKARNTRGGSRKPEENDHVETVMKNIQYGNDHSPDIVSGISWVSSPSTPVSRCPSNLETSMPLPLPPPSYTRTKQMNAQPFVPISNVGIRIKSTNRDAEGTTSGYLTDSASSDCSSECGIGHEVIPPYRKHCEGEALRSHHSSVAYE